MNFAKLTTLSFLCLQRQAAREAKDWIVADNARDKISRMGYTLVDMKGGGDATQIIRQ